MKEIVADIEKVDTLVFDLPLTMRLFELCRETIKDDVHLHTLTAACIELRTQKECLTMEDYQTILDMAGIDPDAEEPDEY